MGVLGRFVVLSYAYVPARVVDVPRNAMTTSSLEAGQVGKLTAFRMPPSARAVRVQSGGAAADTTPFGACDRRSVDPRARRARPS